MRTRRLILVGSNLERVLGKFGNGFLESKKLVAFPPEDDFDSSTVGCSRKARPNCSLRRFFARSEEIFMISL